MNTYYVTIGEDVYEACNGIYAQEGDNVAYEWNPNNKINKVLRIESGEIVTSSGRGEIKKYHKIIEKITN